MLESLDEVRVQSTQDGPKRSRGTSKDFLGPRGVVIATISDT